MECFGEAQTIFTERNRKNVIVWKQAAVTITYFEILVFLNSDNVLKNVNCLGHNVSEGSEA